MYEVILLIHVLIAIGLIGLVLIQQGKGAEMGAAFGSGASQTVFGAQGSGNFLTKTTSLLAAGFFLTSLSLGYMNVQQVKPNTLSDLAVPAQTQPATPKADTKKTTGQPAGASDIPAVPN